MEICYYPVVIYILSIASTVSAFYNHTSTNFNIKYILSIICILYYNNSLCVHILKNREAVSSVIIISLFINFGNTNYILLSFDYWTLYFDQIYLEMIKIYNNCKLFTKKGLIANLLC